MPPALAAALVALTLTEPTPDIPEPEQGASSARLVAAAPIPVFDGWTSRRLYNAGLVAEESRDWLGALRWYLAAGLAPRGAYADRRYAEAASGRLVRVLAPRDEDAAAAVAATIEGVDSDLGPLVRLLRRRVDEADGLRLVSGTLVSLRWRARSGRVLVELLEAEGGSRVIEADTSVAPFSAGDRLRAMIRAVPGRAATGWRLVALGRAEAPGWQLLRVDAPAVEAAPLLGGTEGRRGDRVVPRAASAVMPVGRRL